MAGCHPPYDGKQKSVQPPKEVIKACSPRLEAELAALPVETIVALGNTAAKYTTGSTQGITQLRGGPPKSNPKYSDIRIIPTIHPAAALRNADHFPSIVTDFGKIKSGLWEEWQEPTFAVFEDSNQAIAALRELIHRGEVAGELVVAVDLEVGVDKDEDWSHPELLLCAGLSYDTNKAIVIGEEPCADKRVRQVLGELLQSDHIRVLAHNGKYDLQVLMRMGIIDEPKLAMDTMLASYICDERPGFHGLKVLGPEILGSPQWDAELRRYLSPKDSYAVIPRDVLYKYNAYDVSQTYNLWRHFDVRLAEENSHHLHDRMVRISNTLIRLELEGIQIDDAYNRELAEAYLDTLEALADAMKEWVENPRSPKQVKEALGELGVKVDSTAADILETILERVPQDSPVYQFVDLLLKHRDEAKQYGTYVKGIRTRMYQGRVYTTFLQHGSTSGRLASRNPNLQNIDRRSRIRRQFVPAAGHVFVQADYKQVEGRVMCTEAKEPYLRDIFADPDRDLFDEMTMQLYGQLETGEEGKAQRVRTKAYFYGVGYGREAFSIAMEYGISERQAQQELEAFLDLIPNVVAWQAAIRDQVLRQGKPLETFFGRKRRFNLITRDNQKDVIKEAYSFLPQSTANDICLNALTVVEPILREQGLGAVRIPVHDSILVECPEDNVVAVSEVLDTHMVAAAQEYTDYVPFGVDIEVGTSWGDLSNK